MPEEVEQFISEAMECPVCTQVYDRPKQLHCGHSLCSQCVDRMVELEGRNSGLGGFSSMPTQVRISCPVCRRYTTVPPSGLPVNYALGELISRFNTAQDLKRPCSMCNKVVMYESQLYCKICSQESNLSTCVLCVRCALVEHSQLGHTVEQVEPALESARRDAVQRINDFKGNAALCVSQWESAIENLVPTVLGFTESAANHLTRFDMMINELEQMDVCPMSVSAQKILRAERLGRAFSEMAHKVTWMQNVRAQVRHDTNAMNDAFDQAEFGEVPSQSGSASGNLQDLTINENPEDGPSNGNGLSFSRNTPPQRPMEAVRQRRNAAMARRRANARHVLNSPQRESTSPPALPNPGGQNHRVSLVEPLEL